MKRYIVNNERTRDLLEMYCRGRSYIWNMFFGWRHSHFSNDDWKWSIYVVPEYVFKEAQYYADKWAEENA